MEFALYSPTVNFGVDEGDKIGLIGINGTGKSTLLRILAGLDSADNGRITCCGGLKMEYLPQNPEFDPQASVLAQVFKGASPVMQLLREYEMALEAAQQHPGQEMEQQRLIRLGQQMDAQKRLAAGKRSQGHPEPAGHCRLCRVDADLVGRAEKNGWRWPER